MNETVGSVFLILIAVGLVGLIAGGLLAAVDATEPRTDLAGWHGEGMGGGVRVRAVWGEPSMVAVTVAGGDAVVGWVRAGQWVSVPCQGTVHLIVVDLMADKVLWETMIRCQAGEWVDPQEPTLIVPTYEDECGNLEVKIKCLKRLVNIPTDVPLPS